MILFEKDCGRYKRYIFLVDGILHIGCKKFNTLEDALDAIKEKYYNNDFEDGCFKYNYIHKINRLWNRESPEFIGRDCLEGVKRDGNYLEYVREQTEELCLEAVRQNGVALEYVKEQTEEICLAAINENSYALRYVKKQTEEICLKAINRNSYALKYVQEEFKHLFN